MTAPWSRRLVASALAGLASAGVAFAATMLVWILLDDFVLTVVPSAAGAYWLAGLVGFVVVLLGGLFGSLLNWWRALVTGVVAGIVALLIALFSQAPGTGFKYLWTFLGNYTFFIVALIVATTLLGRRVHAAALAHHPRRGAPVVLVRAPSVALAEGLVTHLERTPVDTERADAQWDAYVAAFAEAGWRTVEIEPADRLPDGVFVEDAAVVFGHVGLVTIPGAPARRAETATVADGLREQGLVLYDLEAPGTLDGGDVLQVGTTIYVGRSDRTNAEGVRQLREVVATLPGEHSVVAVPLEDVLHLKTAAGALPDGTVLLAPALADKAPFFGRSIVVPEASGANVVALSDDTVLMAASAPRTADLVADLGYRVVAVDLSEFEKLEGSATCLSVRLR